MFIVYKNSPLWNKNRRNRTYSIGEVWNSIKSYCAENIKEERYQNQLESAFLQLEQLKIMDSLLIRDNFEFERYTVQEAEDLSESILSLKESFLRPYCGLKVAFNENCQAILCCNGKCREIFSEE